MRGFSMRGFIDSSPFTFDERGFPHGDQDHSFYVAYKTGYKVCCVTSPNGTVFWGTTPDTSLAEQGITVDKQISPQFGLNFSHKTT